MIEQLFCHLLYRCSFHQKNVTTKIITRNLKVSLFRKQIVENCLFKIALDPRHKECNHKHKICRFMYPSMKRKHVFVTKTFHFCKILDLVSFKASLLHTSNITNNRYIFLRLLSQFWHLLHVTQEVYSVLYIPCII